MQGRRIWASTRVLITAYKSDEDDNKLPIEWRIQEKRSSTNQHNVVNWTTTTMEQNLLSTLLDRVS